MQTNYRTRSGVVVVAQHPTLGPLYWRLIDESSVGSVKFCTLTRDINQALLLEPDWRSQHQHPQHYHVRRMLREQVTVYRDFEYWGVDEKVVFEGDLDTLQRASGQNEGDFLAWLLSASWVDVPGPVLTEQRVDHGFFDVWEAV